LGHSSRNYRFTDAQLHEIVPKIRGDLEHSARLAENRKGKGWSPARAAPVSQINYAGLKKLPKAEILDLCEALLAAGPKR
jgi:hypothetical protein